MQRSAEDWAAEIRLVLEAAGYDGYAVYGSLTGDDVFLKIGPIWSDSDEDIIICDITI